MWGLTNFLSFLWRWHLKNETWDEQFLEHFVTDFLLLEDEVLRYKLYFEKSNTSQLLIFLKVNELNVSFLVIVNDESSNNLLKTCD